MKIGLLGFGKAGKAVAAVILQNPDFSLQWILKNTAMTHTSDAKEILGISAADPAKIFARQEIETADFLEENPVDIIIDFSSASSIYTYAKAAAKLRIKIISAISHYDKNDIEFLKKLSTETVIFWSPNITLGVNYLLFAATLLKNIAPGVDIEINEEHFKSKAGVSGTAIKIAESLDLDANHINSVRAGGIVGKHEVIFGFPYQTVRLVHESISREAFGSGALFVAENLRLKKKGFYNFEDLLRPYFQTEAAQA